MRSSNSKDDSRRQIPRLQREAEACMHDSALVPALPDVLSRVALLRAGGAVRRWHTLPTATEQTVAAHSWGVAVLLLEVWPERATRTMLQYALGHDVAECHTGDVPATAKWRSAELRSALRAEEDSWATEHGLERWTSPEALGLTTEMHDVLRAADMLELVLWCDEQEELGAGTLHAVRARGIGFLRGLAESYDAVWPSACCPLGELLDALQEEAQ